jgi:hypothetical protein
VGSILAQVRIPRVRTQKSLAEVACILPRQELPELPETYDAGRFLTYARGNPSRAANVEAGICCESNACCTRLRLVRTAGLL